MDKKIIAILRLIKFAELAYAYRTTKQTRLRRACASPQSRQTLRCPCTKCIEVDVFPWPI